MIHTVHVERMADIQLGLRKLNERWQQAREEALIGALLHGGFAEGVMARTPESLTDRYRDPISEAKDNRYGQARLLKSMFYNKSDYEHPTFFVQRKAGGCSVIFGPSASADVPYAKAMHEHKTPQGVVSHPVEYKIIGPNGKERTIKKWTKGWSKEASGPKYIEKPWDDNRFNTERELIKNIDEELAKVGLL